MLSKRVPALSNVATLAALVVLITAAWVVTAFNRVGLAGAKEGAAAPTSATVSGLQATPVSSQAATRPTVLSQREPIVYVIKDDSAYYHCPVHAMHEAQRQAVALTVAKSRGLAPCPVCFRAK